MAPTSYHTIQTKGICYGLSAFDPELKNLKAIVAGANSIPGQHMIQAMSEEPERWSDIYALSRRPPLNKDSLGPRTKYIPVDFLKSPEEIANILKEHNVQAYIHFSSLGKSRSARLLTMARSILTTCSSLRICSLQCSRVNHSSPIRGRCVRSMVRHVSPPPPAEPMLMPTRASSPELPLRAQHCLHCT